MRLALQALFTTNGANEEEATRRALLERKLRANERSAGFFRRLRVAADDPTLGAPEIFAEESFPDANVVAEYLDGQAAPELARDYEDACWDSPEMLAEVGRCCDILNNDALNSVVAPKNCRRRLYYIAWEESAINVLPEAGTPILTANLAIPESRDAQDETKASVLNEVETGENAEILTADRAKVKRKEERKKPKSVRSTLEAERSWFRRGKRLSARLALASGLLVAGYYGWQTLQEKPSETLLLETPSQKIEAANRLSASLENGETPLCPTTISSADTDQIPTISLEENWQTAANETFDELAKVESEEMEPPKLAILPSLPSETVSAQANEETPRPNAQRRRVGLGSDEPWQSRPAIQIPAQNNDVFMKTELY